MNGSTCRSCGAEIRWAISTTTGKLIPVDAKPAPGITGNIMLTTDEQRREWATVLSKTAALSAPPSRFISHFATCPNAAAHRKKGGTP